MKQNRLSDTDVQEIARMQRVIDTYEVALMSLYFKSKGKKTDVITPIFEDVPFLNKYYKVICDKIENK